MKKIITLALLALPLWAAAQQTATIRIDTERIIDRIDPKIYGAFMEPIGRDTEHPIVNNLYGPLYDPASPKANADGFNRELIDMLRELKLTNLRWPGGNFMSSYNWQDGIGPKEQRPVRKDLAWHGFETNHVGTDEWVALCRALGVENVTCINLGFGDIQNAAYWVEYCNVAGGTYFSDLRAKYGNPEPFGIEYWCLGNEMDGYPWLNGSKTVDDYIKIGLEAGKALKNVDPTVKLVVSGSSWYEDTNAWKEWNWKTINAFTGLAEYFSVHGYWGDIFPTENYYDCVGDFAMDFEEKIVVPQTMAEHMNAMWPKHVWTPDPVKETLKLSFDEWAARGNDIYTVMANAMCLNSFIRHADFVKMANFTMLTRLVQTDPETGNFYRSPLFYMFKLFSTNCRGASIDVFVNGETFDAARYTDIPYLDVTSVLAEDGKTVYINVINRHKDKAITTRIENSAAPFTGGAQVTEITGELGAQYTYADRAGYEPKAQSVAVRGGVLSHTFPPHSFTQIVLHIN